MFSCLLIAIAYLFIMKIPRPTGVQDLTGIRVMVTEHPAQLPATDLNVVNSAPADDQLTISQDP